MNPHRVDGLVVVSHALAQPLNEPEAICEQHGCCTLLGVRAGIGHATIRDGCQGLLKLALHEDDADAHPREVEEGFFWRRRTFLI